MDNLREKHKKIIENNKIVLRPQQRLWSQNHNVFTEEVHKIVLSTYDDNGIQLIDSIDTYAYGTSKEIIQKNDENKCSTIIKQFKND